MAENETTSKRRNRLRILIGAAAVLLLVFFSPLAVREMGSDTMAPLIHGKGLPPNRPGDLVLISKCSEPKKLKKGDLVLMRLFFLGIWTTAIWEVEKLPGEMYSVTNSATGQISHLRVPDQNLYLVGRSEKSADSRVLGPFSFELMEGKVLYIHHRKECNMSDGKNLAGK